MSDSIYLETKEKLFKYFPHFILGEKDLERSFSEKRPHKYKGGVPLAYDEERGRLAIDASDTHTLIWGATGSLKTRCVIEPTVKIIGKSLESMIINDPKAEIYNRCAAELKENGYEIICINIRDPELGNAWNPLAIPYKFYLEGDIDRAAEFANDVAFNLMADDNDKADPFWGYSASDCLFGLIMLLLRYCKDHDLDENAINISNLMELRQQLFKNGSRAQHDLLWRYASEDELIAASLSGTIYAPNDTRASILSVFDQKMRTFTIRPSLLDMLANNDFDIGDIGEKPCAVFMIIPDEKTTYNNLVSLFIKQAYEYLIYKAAQNDRLKLNNRVNYVLDEFSSLPPISSMSSLISAARSRDIRFVLAVQGKHQLIKRYGDEAETIKSNCANWIYLTCRELDLLKEISELCGEQRNRTPNISVYDLQHFSKEKCEALVMCGRLKPAKVTLLDIDRFGEKEYTVLDFEHKKRKERIPTKFVLSEEIKSRVAPLLTNVPPVSPVTGNPFEVADNRPKNVAESDSSSIDVDALVKRIDKKIAELEEEEKRKKATEKGTDEDK